MSLSLLPYTIIIYIRAVMRKRTTNMAAKRLPAMLCLPLLEKCLMAAEEPPREVCGCKVTNFQAITKTPTQQSPYF